jgi:uncharacterized RDD family membrane protein YckC
MTEQLTASAPTDQRLAEPWAGWHLRVGAYLIDFGVQLPFVVVSVILSVVVQDPTTGTGVQLFCGLLGLVNAVASLVFGCWNAFVRQGRRGATIGKQCFGLLVISTYDARPIGVPMTIVRYFAHILDALPLCVGYLWPLWDAKRQTFADKLVHTAVLQLPGVRF